MKKVIKNIKNLGMIISYGCLSISHLNAQIRADIENLGLSPNSFWNGSDGVKQFQSGEIIFKNNYNSAFSSWSGFAYSNMSDKTTAGFENQYSAIVGKGANNSETYAVVYPSFSNQSIIFSKLAQKCKPKGLFVTNSTYAALDMKIGSSFSKKFGGDSGNDPDYFLLTISNFFNGQITDTAMVYLADFRSDDNTKDYILQDWKYVNLSKFGYSDSLSFSLSSTDFGQWGMNTPNYFCLDDIEIYPAPFAPPADIEGTTAIYKDSSIIKLWANRIEVIRGNQNISTPELGKADFGNAENALGKAGENGIVSLGDGGVATLAFTDPIGNGKGSDFVVFENGFSNTFLELAFVEVSSDGKRYVRFPAVSYTDQSLQIDAFGSLDTRMIHNLAGKYKANYGTPFDLEDIKDSLGIDIQQINFVRIIDVVGSTKPEWASRDALGQIINDPWPTAFASSGFDLDAVGLINIGVPNAVFLSQEVKEVAIFPNPIAQGQTLQIRNIENAEVEYTVYNHLGAIIKQDKSLSISTQNLSAGVYHISLKNIGSQKTTNQMLIVN